MKKILYSTLLLFVSICLNAQDSFYKDNYFKGRDYYILKSGRAKMFVQSETANIGPAINFMIFDAESINQSHLKEDAFNFQDSSWFQSSSVELLLNGHSFKSFPTTTTTEWSNCGGVPVFKANWWAGGLNITETIQAVSDKGVFRRRFILDAKKNVDKNEIALRFAVPKKGYKLTGNSLTFMSSFHDQADATISIILPQNRAEVDSQNVENLQTKSFVISPHETITIDTYIMVSIPAVAKNEDASRIENLDEVLKEEEPEIKEKWDAYNTLESDDQLVHNMFNSNRNTLPSYFSDLGRIDSGIFQYGSEWVRDASNSTIGLLHVGAFEKARASLVHVLTNMVKDEGVTMIMNKFDDPDKEQFDQTGELLHALKYYVDWTGDSSIIEEFQNKIVSLIERPLNKAFRDETGMLHNRREFWERVYDDAYELAYQVYVIKGLQEARSLSKYFDKGENQQYWSEKRSEWSQIEQEIMKGMLYHPEKSLVKNGHFIKRRNVSGEEVDVINYEGWGVYGAPALVEKTCKIYPCASMALPITLNIIDPTSDLAQNTLNELETLWNNRWSLGGYARYDTSSEIDAPGPWGFATTFILRANHEANNLDRSRRALDWLYTSCGGRTGCLYEEVPLIEAQASWRYCGVLPWTSAEIIKFVVHHMIGIKFDSESHMYIEPKFFDETQNLTSKIRYKDGYIQLTKKGTGAFHSAIVNGKKLRAQKDGIVRMPSDFRGGKVELVFR